jgi:hypothetical protein
MGTIRERILTCLNYVKASATEIATMTEAPPASVRRELARLLADGLVSKADGLWAAVDPHPHGKADLLPAIPCPEHGGCMREEVCPEECGFVSVDHATGPDETMATKVEDGELVRTVMVPRDLTPEALGAECREQLDIAFARRALTVAARHPRNRWLTEPDESPEAREKRQARNRRRRRRQNRGNVGALSDDRWGGNWRMDFLLGGTKKNDAIVRYERRILQAGGQRFYFKNSQGSVRMLVLRDEAEAQAILAQLKGSK